MASKRKKARWSLSLSEGKLSCFLSRRTRLSSFPLELPA